MKFKPHTSDLPTRSVARAVEMYEGDIPVVGPHARILGSIRVLGADGDKDETVGQLAAVEVAKVGGTHMTMVAEDVLTESHTEVDEERTSALAVSQAFRDIGDSMQCTGNTVCIKQQRPPPPTITKTVKTKRLVRYYVVVFVPEELWQRLPKQLRPRAHEPPEAAQRK